MEAETAGIVAFSRREIVYQNWDISVFGDTARYLGTPGEVDGSKDDTEYPDKKDAPWRQIQ